ncbi:hypothetical protein CA13_13090 [Planctomycetes bacterium CA13]|uniref:Metal-dependent hydrolase n=1 Tax=Novipirellula herctigrandis TaxID=2527986 RepID=A0A5C5YZC1_9BACT|nr:hypothetical protein CA13_13090 [Planctomycetes bacterium CA13]
MTTFEHALLGMNGLLATGLQKRHGWKLAALAAFAAIAPDWDGLPMFIDMSRFEHGHRVWGHNLLACFLVALILGTIDYRFDISGRVAGRLVRFKPLQELAPYMDRRHTFSRSTWFVWVAVAFIAALSQIPADALVSGAEGLSDWPLKPLWPFSEWSFVHAMVPWGNVGVMLIFSVAMIAQVKRPKRVQAIATTALVAVAVYIWWWGTFHGQY